MLSALALLVAACAAPLQRPPATQAYPDAGVNVQRPVPRPAGITRPTIGVAFGGGSARGIAHVGVIRWFEEHRIPIDLGRDQHGRAHRWIVRHGHGCH